MEIIFRKTKIGKWLMYLIKYSKIDYSIVPNTTMQIKCWKYSQIHEQTIKYQAKSKTIRCISSIHIKSNYQIFERNFKLNWRCLHKGNVRFFVLRIFCSNFEKAQTVFDVVWRKRQFLLIVVCKCVCVLVLYIQ